MEKQASSVKAVFDRALELESAVERAAYLDEACAAAPELRQKVAAPLKAHADAGSFLEPPGGAPAATATRRCRRAHRRRGIASASLRDGTAGGHGFGPLKMYRLVKQAQGTNRFVFQVQLFSKIRSEP